ncbi:MAG: cobalamin-dependent protein, partial [bacterium]|nr:cobalamin-dependent protein [bacterium]
MKVLLVYPVFPDTFWSFNYALKFISKKSAFPPLGLLTVASMLPEAWEKKLIDMNVTGLKDADIKWADYVFISAMSIQSTSVKSIITRCKKLGIKTVAGGPLFTAWYDKYEDIDYLILNEAEITLPLFLEDLEKGQAKHIYTSSQWA